MKEIKESSYKYSRFVKIIENYQNSELEFIEKITGRHWSSIPYEKSTNENVEFYENKKPVFDKQRINELRVKNGYEPINYQFKKGAFDITKAMQKK